MYAQGDVQTFRCPLCKQSTEDMTVLWERMDSVITANTMPEPQIYWTVKIGCNDCRQETQDTPFHYVGMKCLNLACGSYNTYIIELKKNGHEDTDNLEDNLHSEDPEDHDANMEATDATDDIESLTS